MYLHLYINSCRYGQCRSRWPRSVSEWLDQLKISSGFEYLHSWRIAFIAYQWLSGQSERPDFYFPPDTEETTGQATASREKQQTNKQAKFQVKERQYNDDSLHGQQSQPGQPTIPYHISSRGQTERSKKKRKNGMVDRADFTIPIARYLKVLRK